MLKNKLEEVNSPKGTQECKYSLYVCKDKRVEFYFNAKNALSAIEDGY